MKQIKFYGRRKYLNKWFWVINIFGLVIPYKYDKTNGYYSDTFDKE